MPSLRSPIQDMQRGAVDALLANPVRRRIEPYLRTPSNARGSWYQRPIGAYIPARAGLAGFGASTAVTGAQGTASGVLTGASTTAAIMGGTTSGVLAGAAAGSVVPIIGTAVGAIVGLIASGVLDHKADPEVANFNQAIAIYRQNRLSVLNIANKYLVLAGLFDLTPSQIKGNIPIYKKYGRMGEFRFVNDMVGVINAAAQAGRITASDTPQSVMDKIVQPWIDSWGFGPMVDSNADMITLVILGMVAEYLAGGHSRWYSVGGNYQFGNLPKFSLPQVPAPVTPPPSLAPGVNYNVPIPGQPVPLPAPPIMMPGPGPGSPDYLGTGPVRGAPGTLLDPATAAMIQQMMAQGASQQQAFQAALAAMQNQGMQPSAPVQQAIATDVQRLAQPVMAGAAGALPPWLAYAGIGAGVLIVIFSLARPARK